MSQARRASALATMVFAWVAAIVVCGSPAQAHAKSGHSHAKTTSYFSATTTASVLHVSFAQAPADSIITGSLVDDDAGYATSGFDSGNSSEATASPLYPGSLVVGGPALLCTDVFTCPFTPPAYPLLADASYPRTPSAHVQSGQHPTKLGSVLTVQPGKGTAHAGQNGNSSSTSTGTISLLGKPLGLTIGASQAGSSVSTHGKVLRVRVHSSLSDIHVGPLVHIASVRTSDAITLRHGHKPVDHPHVAIGRVTIAGQKASITNSGISVAGHPLLSLTKKLVENGIEIRTLGVARKDHANSAHSSAGGLEIEFAAPVKDAPYVPNPLASIPPFNQIPGVDLKGTYIGTIELGGAGAVGALQSQRNAKLPPLPSIAGHHHRASTSGGHAASLPSTGSAPTGSVSAGKSPSTPLAATPTSGQSEFFPALTRDDLLTLYLVMAIGTMVIFLGWRGSVLLRRRPELLGRRR